MVSEAEKQKSTASSPFSQKALEKLAETFNLLADAKRLLLLQYLKEGEQTVGDLVELTGLKQAAVSKQLGLMYSGNVLDRRKDGNRVYYKTSDSMIYELCGIVCQKLKREQGEFAKINFDI